MKRPPANPGILVAWGALEVVVMDWPGELAGMLVLREGQALIGLNRRHSVERRHFSFWHEVGHLVLHRDPLRSTPTLCPLLGPGASGEAKLEREADAFATSMLMPAEWVRDSHAELGNLFALARRFAVSPRAMARRLRELRLMVTLV